MNFTGSVEVALIAWLFAAISVAAQDSSADATNEGVGYPPHRTETTVSADCGFASSAITYSVPRDDDGNFQFMLNRLEVFEWGSGNRTALTLPELPEEIQMMGVPVVHLVRSACFDRDGETHQTFIFNMADGYGVRWPLMESIDEITLFTVNIDGEGVARSSVSSLR